MFFTRIAAYPLAAAALLVLTACPPMNSARANGQPTLKQVPHFIYTPLFRQQTEYTCGVSALQSVLHFYGDIDTKEETVAKELGADGTGTRYKAMIAYAQSQGYDVKAEFHMTLAALRAHIDRGNPVIVAMQAWAEGSVDWAKTWDQGHYVVATGYDQSNVYFMDPSTRASYTYIENSEFLTRWHDADADGELIQFGLILEKAGPRFDFNSILPMK